MTEAATRQSVPLGRRIATAVLVLTAAALLAWFTTPQWAPAVASWFLPDEWRIERLELRRPGFAATRVDQVRLRGNAAGAAITVEARDALIAHRGPAIVIDDLDVVLHPSSASGREQSDAPWRNRLALPPVPSAGPWPVLAVSRFTLRMGDPGLEKSYDFENLRLARTAAGGRLSGSLTPVPFLAADGLVSVELRGDGVVDGALALAAAPGQPVLRYRQAADGTTASAQLALDLALLDLTALSPWSAAAGIGAVRAANGRLTATLELSGAEALRPNSGTVGIAALALASEALSADVNGDIAFEGLGANGFRLHTEGFEAALALSREDWLTALEASLRDAGLVGLLEPLPAQLGLLAPGYATLRFDTETGAFEFAGAVSSVWRQDRAANLEFASPELRVARSVGGAFTLGADNFSAAIDHPGELRAEVDDISLEGERVQLRIHGRITVEPGTEPDLEFTLGTATARRLAASLPRLHGEAQNLVLEGRLNSDERGFHFEGPVSAYDLRASEAPAAGNAALLAAGTVRAVLALNASDSLSTRGPMELAGVSVLDDSLRMGRLDLQLEGLSLARGDGAFSAVTTGLERVVDAGALGGLDLDLQGMLEDWNSAAGSGEALAGLARAMPFRWRADLASGAIEIDFENSELEAIGLRGALRPLGVTLPEPLAFQSGSVFLDGTVKLVPGDDGIEPRGAIDLRADGLTFNYGETLVDGLAFRTGVELEEASRSDGRLSAETISLAAGLDLTGLDTGLRTSGESDLGLESLSAELLGGRLEAAQLSVLNGMPQAATVEWLGFDLGRLLAFLDVDGLDGTGTIDARFPIASEVGALTVENGEFAARGPGRIRYTTGAPAANIGLQALENFEYDSLDGKINYAADGAYTIALRLLGRNPDLYGGHPVRFRLNLGGELPALFRSLFVTGDFERAIIERLRTRADETEE